MEPGAPRRAWLLHTKEEPEVPGRPASMP
jgi:hypothetical protein